MAPQRLRAVSPADDQADDQAENVWQSGGSVKAKRVPWLLPGRVVSGTVCVLEGPTSAGKSVLLSAIAASVTTGKPFLGRGRTKPSDVLWLNAEEDFGSLICSRLDAAGANLKRVHVPGAGDDGQARRVTLGGSLDYFRKAILHFRASLLVVEPLLSYLGNTVNPNAAADIRAVLDPLQQLCIATNCTAIITRGLRKNRTGDRLDHGQGSSEIVLLARSVLRIDRPEQDSDRRVLRTLKAGGQLPAPPAEYTLVEKGDAVVMSQIRELTPGEDDSADDCSDPGERGARADAKALLRVLLKSGWVPCAVIERARLDALVSPATLRRAYADLRVRTRQKWDGNSSYHEWGPPEGGF